MKFITIALSIFSMFFGAGNAVFPIILGVEAQNQVFSAFIGMLLSSVLLPGLGFCLVMLCNGSLKDFLSPLGKRIGQSLMGLMAGLLGPLAVMPRCVIVAYESFQSLGYNVDLNVFSFLFCSIAFMSMQSRQLITTALGKILSPILVVSLISIIVFGQTNFEFHLSMPTFSHGFLVGYGTLDLVAALFFAPTVFFLYKESCSLKTMILASSVAFSLLGAIYLGLAVIASHDPSLMEFPKEALLTQLAQKNLGLQGAFIACLSVLLACFTTVIGLTISLNQWFFTQSSLIQDSRKASFLWLGLTAFIVPLGFQSIMSFLSEVLFYLYPLLIGLCLWHMSNRLLKLPSKGE